MIRQFDVFANPVPAARGDQPFVVCIQHRNLDHYSTRLIVPLATDRIVRQPSRLSPEFEIDGRTLYLLPQNLLSVPARLLRDAIENIDHGRDRIIAAVDLMMTGV